MILSNMMNERLGHRSAIRQAFEDAQQLKKEFGSDKVFDYSIGNPTATCPNGVTRAMNTSATTNPALHGYMDSAGYADVRETIATSLKNRFGTNYAACDIIMTTGAACAINITLQSILNPGDEVVIFAPYYAAYEVFINNWQGKAVVVPFALDENGSPQPNIDAFTKALSPKTKAVIVNSPNNPSGVVYSPESSLSISNVLLKAESEFGNTIILISDEPYRELVYDDAANPWFPSLYKDTIVAYSFSKSASVAGERIGYAALTPEIAEKDILRAALCRSLGDLGFVNAPASSQRIAKECADETSDLSYYATNREILLAGLKDAGFTVPPANGAFYALLPVPEGTEEEMLARLKEQNIIAVGGTDFGIPGYLRLSYCLPTQAIKDSLPGFKKVAQSYGL